LHMYYWWERKTPLGRSWPRWVYNIKMDLGDIGQGDMDWIGLAQNSYQWKNGVMNFRVLWKAGNFWSCCTTSSFSSSSQLHRVNAEVIIDPSFPKSVLQLLNSALENQLLLRWESEERRLDVCYGRHESVASCVLCFPFLNVNRPYCYWYLRRGRTLHITHYAIELLDQNWIHIAYFPNCLCILVLNFRAIPTLRFGYYWQRTW
jgi:hypothetical protein